MHEKHVNPPCASCRVRLNRVAYSTDYTCANGRCGRYMQIVPASQVEDAVSMHDAGACVAIPSPLHRAKRARGYKLNKTEQRFLDARPDGNRGPLVAQRMILPLGELDTYRVDFWLPAQRIVIEIKGDHLGKVAWSREGVQKYRRAKEQYPEFKFEMWQWAGQQWRVVE